MRRFLADWFRWGWHVAAYNLTFRILHRHDDHVRVWQDNDDE